MFDIAFAYGLTTTVLIISIGHWFPWPRRLPRLAAYSYGTASILIGAAIWLGFQARWHELAGIIIIACAGGLATAFCYGIDALHNLIQRVKARTHDSHDC